MPNIQHPFTRQLSLIFTLGAIALSGGVAQAQGCVAAHSNQRAMDELVGGGDGAHTCGPLSIHNLTVDVGYRVFNSSKYFQGSTEIVRYPAVENHQNIFDFAFQYRLSSRVSLIADVPVYNGSRDQIYSPSGIYRVTGVGDTTIGVQSWLFKPPTEGHGNVAGSLSLKIPTGLSNATGVGLSKGTLVVATADPSLQPGDGGWGFVVGAQGYQPVWHMAEFYSQGQYVFNPEDTNGVASFRSQAGQSVDSVPDQYLYRFGFAQIMPKIHKLAFSFGVRGEGVPVRDLIGNSNGFRRPGFILSIDPGVMYTFHHTVLSVNGPWAMYRDRPPSVPEIASNTTNGDAFFADYTVTMSLSHHF
jgi:hypothetical protein